MLVMWSLAPAFACSVFCEGLIGDPLVVLPADGEAEVPTNAAPVVAFGEGTLLVDEAGDPVPTEPVELSETLVALRPTAALAPGATYAVVAGEDVLATFTTGDGPADGDLPAVGEVAITGTVRKDLWPGVGLTASCGNVGDGVWLDASWAPTTGLYEVTAEREDGDVVTLVLPAETARLGWMTPCLHTLPDLRPGERVTVTVRAMDVALRLGPASDPIETSARAEDRGCATGTPHATAGALLVALGLARTAGKRGRRLPAEREPASGRAASGAEERGGGDATVSRPRTS